jgi:hypothetical protein
VSGTTKEKVIVVPDFVPCTVMLPRSELLITTSASVAPWRFASATFTIFPVIESPTCTFQWVRFSASPVCGSPPVGWSRLPGPMLSVPDVAAGASSRAESTIPAPTSHDMCLGPELFARASLLVHAMPQFHLIAAVPQTFDYLVKTPVNCR